MTSIGDTLRRERQRRNLELPKIAGELKISARFLEAMEQDDFAKLPGGVFTKSFLRQYAVFLGFDGDEVVAGLEHAAAPDTNGSNSADKPKPDVPGIDLQMGEENWQSVRERRAPLPSWLRAGVLLVVLMLTCSGVYWWWQRPHHQVLAHEIPLPKASLATPPAPVSRPVENPLTTAEPSTALPSATATQPSAEQPSKLAPAESAPAPQTATPAIPVAPPNPNATVRVGITADEDVWVRADVNGKYLFSGTLLAHESRNIDADGEVTLRLGNAGGATLTFNGKPVDAVGPKGQIRTVQFTSGGLKIVSAAKLLDPLERL